MGGKYRESLLFFELFLNSKFTSKGGVKTHFPFNCSGRCTPVAGAGKILQVRLGYTLIKPPIGSKRPAFKFYRFSQL